MVGIDLIHRKGLIVLLSIDRKIKKTTTPSPPLHLTLSNCQLYPACMSVKIVDLIRIPHRDWNKVLDWVPVASSIYVSENCLIGVPLYWDYVLDWLIACSLCWFWWPTSGLELGIGLGPSCIQYICQRKLFDRGTLVLGLGIGLVHS